MLKRSDSSQTNNELRLAERPE